MFMDLIILIKDYSRAQKIEYSKVSKNIWKFINVFLYDMNLLMVLILNRNIILTSKFIFDQ